MRRYEIVDLFEDFSWRRTLQIADKLIHQACYQKVTLWQFVLGVQYLQEQTESKNWSICIRKQSF